MACPPSRAPPHARSSRSTHGGAVAAACYLPILAKFGHALFRVNNALGYPPAAVVIERGTVGVWGWVGVIVLAIMIVAAVMRVVLRRGEPALPAPPRLELFAWGL